MSGPNGPTGPTRPPKGETGSAPQRIVRKLAILYPEVSASRLKRAVLAGQVSINGTVTTNAGALVSAADEVLWDANRPTIRTVGGSLQVLYEDDDAVVVFKPAGLLAQPTTNKERDTLLARVSNYIAARSTSRPYVAVVHRIDKDTSGLLVYAKSRRGLHWLQAQLRTHATERTYLAIVEGDMAGDKGRFEDPLVDDRGDGRRGVARPGQEGVEAITTWKVLERFGIATLVEVRLETGRTHQIRIHFAHSGHPVVGDPVYRDRKLPPFPYPFPRQALHAAVLGFDTVEGPHVVRRAEPPTDFQDLLASLRQRPRQQAPAKATTPVKQAPPARRRSR